MIYQCSHPIGFYRWYFSLFLTFISCDVQVLHSYFEKYDPFILNIKPSRNLSKSSLTKYSARSQKLAAILICLQNKSSLKFGQSFCYKWMFDCCNTSKTWNLQEVLFYEDLILDWRDWFLIEIYRFFPIRKSLSFIHFKHWILRVVP